MHVVIATDGQLDAATAATFAARLAGDEGRVTVLSVVEVPRRLLDDLRRLFGTTTETAMSLDHEHVDVREVLQVEGSSWPGDDAMIERYLHDQGEERTGALLAELQERGVEPIMDIREGEEPSAGVLAAVEELEADVLCIGSHGRGRFQGLLGSTGSKITRLAHCPVLLIHEQ